MALEKLCLISTSRKKNFWKKKSICKSLWFSRKICGFGNRLTSCADSAVSLFISPAAALRCDLTVQSPVSL